MLFPFYPLERCKLGGSLLRKFQRNFGFCFLVVFWLNFFSLHFVSFHNFNYCQVLF